MRNIILTVATITLLMSCGKKTADTSTLEGKKAHLSELKTEATKLNDEVAKLEQEIAAADPTAKKERVTDRKSTRLNSSHRNTSRMPSSA